MQSWSFQKSTSTNDFIKKLPPQFEFLSTRLTAAMRYLAIAHQTFQPSWLVEVLNAMTNTSLNSSVGRASVYQTEGPEFNPRLGRKSFESFLNFYLINNVSAEGKSRFSYIMGITSSAIMKLPKIHFHQWMKSKSDIINSPLECVFLTFQKEI